ncbi:MAG: tetratricopeptide repeat protein [Bacteroidia bacterium]|nr:tetratricopeptide repeat protein [Bacteroidia bacterium]
MNRFKKIAVSFLIVSSISFAFADAKIDSLQNVLDNTTNDTLKINLLNRLSWTIRSNDPQKALKYTMIAKALAESLVTNTDTILDSTLFKALASSYNSIGIIQKNLGNYETALDYYIKSLRMREKLGNQRSVAGSYNNIGIVYKNLKNYEQALAYYYKALEINKETNNKLWMAYNYNNIGVAYQVLGKYDEALEANFNSMEIKKEIGKGEISSSYNNIGEIYIQKGEYDKALEYIMKAINLVEESGDTYGMMIFLSGAGMVYKKKGDYAKAIDYFNQSLDLAKDYGGKKEMRNAYLRLAKSYAELNDFEEAYSFFNSYNAIKDSLFTEESTKAVAEMREKYEADKKENAIQILERDQQITELEVKRQKVFKYSFLGGLILFGILAVILYNRYQFKKRANKLLHEQKEQIELQNKNIMDSISYAKRIQNAILIPKEEINQYLTNCFILYKPRDVVSGDFYYFSKKGNRIIISAVDCTGHGVPGAFMSMIGNELLNQIVNQKNILKPDEILEELNDGVMGALRQNKEDSDSIDGMDLALCTIDMQNKIIEYAGAHNPLYIVRNNIDSKQTHANNGESEVSKLEVIKADKIAIGGAIWGSDREFTNHTVSLNDGDAIYMFSDGYWDQFGGPKNKRFKSKKFKEIILEIQGKSMQEQHDFLDKTIEDWRGEYEQTDDITVIGIRV